LNSNRL